jgi:hypothetical protein
MSLFKDVKPSMSIEEVASKLVYFTEQSHLNHFRTSSYAEHKALDELYSYLQGFKDDVVEKLMGYTNRRLSAYPLLPLKNDVNSTSLCEEIMSFSLSLEKWASDNKFCDIENMSQELSGTAAKTKYLLTLS